MKKIVILLGVLTLLGAGCTPTTNPSNQTPTATTVPEKKVTSAIVFAPNKDGKTTYQPLAQDNQGKFELIPGKYNKTPTVCNEPFNQAAANTSATYANTKYGLLLTVRFNEAWGNSTFTLKPYDETTGKHPVIYFGNVSAGVEPGCDLSRQYKLYIKPAASTKATLATLTALGATEKPVTKTNQGKTFIEYRFLPEQCTESMAMITVIGKKYNYELVGQCDSTFQELEGIVSSVKLIGQTVSIEGMALDSIAGAVVSTPNGAFYIKNLDTWPEDFFKKSVTVTGVLSQEKYIPSPSTESGVDSEGSLGKQWVISDAKWKLK